MMTQNADKKREQIQLFCMDDMVPQDHLLRIIDKAIDWSFIYELVEDKYSQDNGRPSMDPVMLIKIPFIQYLYGIKSMRQTVKEIEAMGGKAEALQCNVSDYDKAAEMMAYVVKTYGRVDILVNNAGITRDNLLMKMSEEDFDAVLNTNLKGAFNCIKHISRQMLKQKSGHIVNISSVSGVMGNAGQVNYSASKAGVIGMTKAVAREMASRGSTCNAVAPGFIKTDMTDVLSDTIRENINAQIPMRTFGETADVANLVAFLASDEAKYITGQVICVDGGMAI